MRESVYQCPCVECTNDPTGDTASLHAGINLMVATLDEKNRRRFAGLCASHFGYGGVQQIARITGLSRTTITRGQKEIEEAESATEGRVRARGGGRQRIEKKTRPS